MSIDDRHQRHSKHTLVAFLLLFTTAVELGGCAGASVKGEWQAGAPRNETFSRLLVVGVNPDYNLRCAFEEAFASQLRSAATTVFSSCAVMTPQDPLTRESIERVVASVHVDAVLATRLVSAATGHQKGGSNDTRGYSYYKATDYGYGAYGMPVTFVDLHTTPPLTNLTSSIHVVTKLYDTRDAKLLYTLDTVTKSQEIDSTEATLLTITAPTADRLRREGLIR